MIKNIGSRLAILTILPLFIGFISCAWRGSAPTPPSTTNVGETSCSEIEETRFPSPVQDNDITLRRQELCTTVAQCVATEKATLAAMGAKYCASSSAAEACKRGSCSLGQDCKTEARIGTPPVVKLANCASVPDPKCTVAGEQLCKCDLIAPKRESLHCGCRCKSSPT